MPWDVVLKRVSTGGHPQGFGLRLSTTVSAGNPYLFIRIGSDLARRAGWKKGDSAILKIDWADRLALLERTNAQGWKLGATSRNEHPSLTLKISMKLFDENTREFFLGWLNSKVLEPAESHIGSDGIRFSLGPVT
jgi:hypothetical protein